MLPIDSTREDLLEWIRSAYTNRTARPNGSSVEYIYHQDIGPNFELFAHKVGNGFDDCVWAIEQLAPIVNNPRRSGRVQLFVEKAMTNDLTLEQITRLLPYAGKSAYRTLIERALDLAEQSDKIDKGTLIVFIRKHVL